MDDHRNENGRPPWVDGLAKEIDPPPRAVGAIVAALRSQGLVRDQTSLRWRGLAAVAAVAVIAFAAGWLAHAATARAGIDGGPRFVLFLVGETSNTALDGGVAEYGAWARRVRAEGRAVSGERLADEQVAIAAPASPGSSQTTGFFIIEAATYAEAASLAEAHPHVRHGGGILIRRIEPTER